MSRISGISRTAAREEGSVRARGVGHSCVWHAACDGEVPMHAVFFGCKRAFHSTLRLTRKTLAKMGLTAARFDLLYALHSKGEYGALQSDLRRTLGVCPSVVSRMLKAIESLGYVTRARARGDTRQRIVRLTNKGRARIQRGIRQFISWGYVQLALESVLVPDAPPDSWRSLVAVDNAETLFRLLRHGFGDSADLSYPWHPDD